MHRDNRFCLHDFGQKVRKAFRKGSWATGRKPLILVIEMLLKLFSCDIGGISSSEGIKITTKNLRIDGILRDLNSETFE
jgi:hypothetical protein